MDIRKELHGHRLVSCYVDRPTNLLARIDPLFDAQGDRLAIVDGDERVAYRQLQRQAFGIAALLARAGIVQGDRVGVMLPNSADAVRAILALLYLGAVLVPIGTRSRGPEIAHIADDSGLKLIVHATSHGAEIAQAGHHGIDVGDDSWRDAVDQGGRRPAPLDIGEHDLFGILYTSGTTGRPKGVMLSHFNMIHSCRHWIEAFALTPDDRTLFAVPWTHVSGLGGVLMPFLSIGGTQVMLREFKRRDALERAAAERITHALMVPAMYALLLLEPDLASFDLHMWRIGAFGGAPMPEPTATRFAAVFPDLAMCNCYGATETTSPVTITRPGEDRGRLDSIGRAVRCGEIRVMDERGHEVPVGQDGELWIGGPMVSSGYWGDSDATEQAFVAGFWKSGDIGSTDAEGYVRIADRKKDMIIRGGFKVYPAEVESVLTAIDGVVEAAVVGRPDDILGEAVVAFVHAHESSATPESIRAHCAARLSDYKVPGIVLLSDAPLPRNANGKIQKAELRSRAAAARESLTI